MKTSNKNYAIPFMNTDQERRLKSTGNSETTTQEEV